MRGRPPTPTAVAIVRGNPGRRSFNANEPNLVVPRRMPSPPTRFNEEQREIWFELGHRAMRARVLTEYDLLLFEELCYWTWKTRRCEREMEGQSLTLSSKNGGYIHPLESHHAMCSKQVRELAAHFGMSPMSRTKVQTVEPMQRGLFGKLDDDDDDEPIDVTPG